MAARSSVLCEIAARYIGHNRPEKARTVSHENLVVIAQIRDESSQAAALANLSDVYGEAHFEIADGEKQYLTQLVQKTEW